MLLISIALLTTPPTLDTSLPEGLQLLERGDRKAQNGAYGEALKDYKAGYDHILPTIRGLDFKEITPTDVVTRDQLAARLKKTMSDEDREDLVFFDNALKCFGVLPEPMSFEKLVFSLLEAEVAGYYDPTTSRITLVDAAPEVARPSGSFWGGLFQSEETFNVTENRGVIAHELTHALTDQHYDLEKLQNARRDSDDASMALDAVIEGDAMIAMVAAMQEDFARAATLFQSGSRYWRFAFGLVSKFAPGASSPAMRAAPPFFGQALMFPYTEGMVFLLEVGKSRGYAAVDDVYGRLPESTEQVIHPERYLKRDPPMVVDEPDWPKSIASSRLGSNVLGEAQLRFVLDDREAAAGWGGDRYTVFRSERGRTLVWMTAWDTEHDAQEFADSWRGYIQKRLRRNRAQPEPEVPEFVQARLDFSNEEQNYRIQRRGSHVLVMEGNPNTVTAARDIAWSALKRAIAAPAELD